MIVNDLYNSIELGKTGFNTGLPTGMPKLDSLTYGIQRKWMTVIAGDSGSGKSSYMLYTQIFKPFQQYMQNKSISLNFLIFSFEMSAEVLLTKLLSMYLYETYGEVVSYDEILSLSKHLTPEHDALVQQAKEWLLEFEQHCEIIDKPVTAKGIYAICKEWTKKFGKYNEYESNGEYIKEDYIPNDPKQYLVVCVDHIKLVAVSAGHTARQEIDDSCNYLIHFRNKCNVTVNIVQQLNRNFKSMERRTSDNNLLGLEDLSESSGPAQASETVIGIYFPFREKRAKCVGYDVKALEDRIKIIQVLKNRFGMSDRAVGACFYGECGIWVELPKPEEITDYQIYKDIV